MLEVNDEILKNRIDRMNSIYYQFINNDLNKSISDDLGYSGVKITKTGKEIKDKIQEVILSSIQEKISCENALKQLSAIINEQPLLNDIPYSLQDLNIPIPLKYSYDQKSGESVNNKEKEQYNQLVNRLGYLIGEIMKLKTIYQHMDDGKKFELPVNLATKLGF